MYPTDGTTLLLTVGSGQTISTKRPTVARDSSMPVMWRSRGAHHTVSRSVSQPKLRVTCEYIRTPVPAVLQLVLCRSDPPSPLLCWKVFPRRTFQVSVVVVVAPCVLLSTGPVQFIHIVDLRKHLQQAARVRYHAEVKLTNHLFDTSPSQHMFDVTCPTPLITSPRHLLLWIFPVSLNF